jgi:hypothetical protein
MLTVTDYCCEVQAAITRASAAAQLNGSPQQRLRCSVDSGRISRAITLALEAHPAHALRIAEPLAARYINRQTQ